MAQKRKPVTVDELESFLDLVARLMEKAGRDAELLLPIWRALERELNARREAASIFAAARARISQNANQRSSTSS